MATTIDPHCATFVAAVPAVGWQSFRAEMERLFDGLAGYEAAGAHATFDSPRPIDPRPFTPQPGR